MTPELITNAQKMALACIKSDYRECGLVIPATHQLQVLAKITNPSSLKVSFKAQPLLKRKQLKYALKELRFYTYGVDGLWGKGTKSGFERFVDWANLEGRSESAVFRDLLSRVDVSNSFAVAKKKTTSSSKHKAAMGYRPYGNKTMSVQQGIDVCEGGA